MAGRWLAGRPATVSNAPYKSVWRIVLDQNACAKTDDQSRWHARCCMTTPDTGTQANACTRFFGAVASWGRGLEPRATRRGSRTSITRTVSPGAAPQDPVRGTSARETPARRSGSGSYPICSVRGTYQKGVRATREHQPAVSVSSGSPSCTQKNQIRPVNEAVRTVGFIPVTPRLLGKRQPKVADSVPLLSWLPFQLCSIAAIRAARRRPGP